MLKQKSVQKPQLAFLWSLHWWKVKIPFSRNEGGRAREEEHLHKKFDWNGAYQPLGMVSSHTSLMVREWLNDSIYSPGLSTAACLSSSKLVLQWPCQLSSNVLVDTWITTLNAGPNFWLADLVPSPSQCSFIYLLHLWEQGWKTILLKMTVSGLWWNA